MKSLKKTFAVVALVMLGLSGAATAHGAPPNAAPPISNALCTDKPREATIEDVLEDFDIAAYAGSAVTDRGGYNVGPDADRDIGDAIDGHTFLTATIDGQAEYLLVDNEELTVCHVSAETYNRFKPAP
jgi:hypothetical protein